MYVPRVQYEDCCSFQDTNSKGSSQPDSLFNLTKNYYFVVSNEADNITQCDTNKCHPQKD